MVLNLAKIKSEASKEKEKEALASENQEKISEGVNKHRKDLQQWFTSLFPDENIQTDYIETSVLFAGGTKVSLAIQLITKCPSGNMIPVNDKVNFMFKKTKNKEIIASTVFVDETDYLNIEPESKDYKYSYTVQEEKRTYIFSELEQFLQYVIDK
ncbi:hypothetical protein B9X71_13205 [Acinetobacter baumannii]|uniref:hypothetical protein n=1 Tax=Acinetobacter baumannii TaxID=470 RepID=UPI000A34AF27|nr:hypothetical protein [Acinetobacter baumannii]MCT9166404.1 hypothetical protein [Acinetobacter baumannii]MCT9173637.1 hypothetical protein [Acinetobacter baumannii]MCT9180924.1 hypothetical protein [Acinetobacter baumannii]OTK45905.1 hypothetical protein B9X71_13205 [Acinetobacter baumannii]